MKNFERLKYLWVVVIFFVGLAAYEFIGYSQYKKSETPPPPTIFVGKSAENGKYPLFRRYVEKNRQGYQSTWLLPDGLGDHALLDGQDDIFIYAPYGKSYHKLIGNKRMENGDKTCWRGVYTWFETPVADDADLLCYEGSAGGHTAVFIDCKRACKRTLALPGYLDLRHFGTAEQNGGIRISAAGRNKLKIKADAPGSCVLLLRE